MLGQGKRRVTAGGEREKGLFSIAYSKVLLH